jgi:hypothetical protein
VQPVCESGAGPKLREEVRDVVATLPGGAFDAQHVELAD